MSKRIQCIYKAHFFIIAYLYKHSNATPELTRFIYPLGIYSIWLIFVRHWKRTSRRAGAVFRRWFAESILFSVIAFVFFLILKFFPRQAEFITGQNKVPLFLTAWNLIVRFSISENQLNPPKLLLLILLVRFSTIFTKSRWSNLRLGGCIKLWFQY